jgi:hypothetical protein
LAVVSGKTTRRCVEMWDTDLTAPEKERLARALAIADFRNWSPLELADKIAGTVRAIAAARLAEVPR